MPRSKAVTKDKSVTIDHESGQVTSNEVELKGELIQWEALINEGRFGLFLAGLGLETIREKKLYQLAVDANGVPYRDMDSYCWERWRIKRTARAYWMKSAKIAAAVGLISDKGKVLKPDSLLLNTSGWTRPMYKLTTDQVMKVWDVVSQKPETEITEVLVRETVEQVIGSGKKKPNEPKSHRVIFKVAEKFDKKFEEVWRRITTENPELQGKLDKQLVIDAALESTLSISPAMLLNKVEKQLELWRIK